MTLLEDEFVQIIGKFPSYMRIPYLSSNDAILAAMAELGYHVIGASIDTKDYENDDADLIWKSFEKFRQELDAGGSIVLSHDTHLYTVETLAENMLKEIQSRGLKGMLPLLIYLSSSLGFWLTLVTSCHCWRVSRRLSRELVSHFAIVGVGRGDGHRTILSP